MVNIFHEGGCDYVNGGLGSHFLDDHVNASSQNRVFAEEEFGDSEEEEVGFFFSEGLASIKVVDEVFDDFGTFGGFELAFVEAASFVQSLGLVDFDGVFFRDGADLVEVVLAGLVEAFDEVDVALHGYD